jgi:hypothetical protein
VRRFQLCRYAISRLDRRCRSGGAAVWHPGRGVAVQQARRARAGRASGACGAAAFGEHVARVGRDHTEGDDLEVGHGPVTALRRVQPCAWCPRRGGRGVGSSHSRGAGGRHRRRRTFAPCGSHRPGQGRAGRPGPSRAASPTALAMADRRAGRRRDRRRGGRCRPWPVAGPRPPATPPWASAAASQTGRSASSDRAGGAPPPRAPAERTEPGRRYRRRGARPGAIPDGLGERVARRIGAAASSWARACRHPVLASMLSAASSSKPAARSRGRRQRGRNGQPPDPGRRITSTITMRTWEGRQWPHLHYHLPPSPDPSPPGP